MCSKQKPFDLYFEIIINQGNQLYNLCRYSTKREYNLCFFDTLINVSIALSKSSVFQWFDVWIVKIVRIELIVKVDTILEGNLQAI